MSKPLRKEALELYRAGLQSVTPELLVNNALHYEKNAITCHFLDRRERVLLPAPGQVCVVAVGKAAAPMAKQAQSILGSAIKTGLIVTKYGFGLDSPPFEQLECGHPTPDEAGEKAARRLEALVKPLGKDDILLALISGGTSALLPAPIPGISLAEKQALTQGMLAVNLDIHQINTVRKAMSRLKGGGLAALAAPAQSLGLYLSDVPGDSLGSIGSGLTQPETIDAQKVVGLLRSRGLWSKTPEILRQQLEKGQLVSKTFIPPPLHGLIGTNRHLLQAVEKAAKIKGYRTHVVEEPTTGLNPKALPLLMKRWTNLCANHSEHSKLCLISGGETTVEVKGTGKGGRCQELAAQMMPLLRGKDVFLAAGSDANDGPTDAAGGVVDAESWRRVQQKKLAYRALLENNDSYTLLKQSQNLIQEPPSRNNVMDLHVFLRG